jgi:pSer/pThr/pTyr-binding forkhead associated (FHA) protein
MSERRQHSGSTAHAIQGPHARHSDTPEVAPLRLLVMPTGSAIEVAQPAVVVGRHSEAELRLPYPDVSRRHCRLAFSAGAWQIRDLDSLNGLFVNGERMHEATLYEGDEIRLGTVALRVLTAPPPRILSGNEAQVLRSISEVLEGQ